MESLLRYKLKIKRSAILIDAFSSLLLILFLYTALSKLGDYAGFKSTLSRSPLLSPFAAPLAILIPVAELVIAVLLFIPALRKWGLHASFILLILFTGYLIYMVTFASDLPCSCGGALASLTWRQHIFFNLFFVMIAISAIIIYNRDKNRRSAPPP